MTPAGSLRSEASRLAELVARFRIGEVGEKRFGLEIALPGRHRPALNPVGRAQARLATSLRAVSTGTDGWQEF